MNEILLPCFLLENVNAIAIYFTFVKQCLDTIKIKLEDKYDVQWHKYQSSIDRVIVTVIQENLF